MLVLSSVFRDFSLTRNNFSPIINIRMKQGIWVFLAIMQLLISNARADFVNYERAKQIAEAFLTREQAFPPLVMSSADKQIPNLSQAASLNLGQIQSIKNDQGEILAYIQELEPVGFIILSTDDTMNPIRGFSFTTHFPYFPEGNSLMNLIKVDARERKEAILSGEIGAYPLTSIGPTAEWGPYIETTWSQGGIYRAKCPYMDPSNPGARRLAGCTAIAMAQIMYMHQYPRSIYFSTDEDHYRSRSAVRNEQGEILSYDVIDIDGSSSQYGFPTFSQLNTSLNQILYNGNEEEISNFCFATGVKLQTSYGRNGSGALLQAQTYLEDFGYGSAIGSSEWDKVRNDVIQNMKDRLPVQIGVFDSKDWLRAHSIIVDGYRDDEFFHLNYGWGADDPDLNANCWYNIPGDMERYDVVGDVVYDISVYKGWNQIAADPQNSYHASYAAPIDEPLRKWSVGIPSELASISTPYSFSHLIIGTGSRICAALSPSYLGEDYHPYIAAYDKFGSLKKLIEVTYSNVKIPVLCQNSQGEVFFPASTAGPTATGTKVFRFDPETDSITSIFTHSSPDAGTLDMLKIDADNYLYFVVKQQLTSNYAKFYCISRTGGSRWTPYSFSSSAEFHITQPAIDEDRDRAYLNYFIKTETYRGLSHLIAFNTNTGSVVFDIALPTSTHYASGMANTPSIGTDGTIYIDANKTLFAVSPTNGSILWQRQFSWRNVPSNQSIGLDNTLYVAYDDYVRAIDMANGSTKWEKYYSLTGENYLGEIYSAPNGMVIISYDKDGIHRLGGIRDNMTSYTSNWDIAECGGTIAFGPGRTLVMIPPGHENSIWTITDKGERGDPEGMAMDYIDNKPPSVPSVISPADGAVQQSSESITLNWDCTDQDPGQSITYDVYACAIMEGEEVALVPFGTQLTGGSYTLTGLRTGLQYLWAVVATDGQAITSGPIWSFATDGFITSVHESMTSFMADSKTEGIFLSWELIGDFDLCSVYRMEADSISWHEIAKGIPPLVTTSNQNSYQFFDKSVIVNNYYKYMIVASNKEGFSYEFGPNEVVYSPALTFNLHQNYPNPFNPLTKISFTNPERAFVNLTIYNVEGKLVKVIVNEMLDQGRMVYSWDGLNAEGHPAASGIYFYRLKSGKKVIAKKMVLLR